MVGRAAIVASFVLAVSIITPAAADRTDEELKFSVLDKNADDPVNNTLIDVGTEGFSVGDYFVIGADAVFRPDGVREVGLVTGDCLVVQINAQTFAVALECDATFVLQGRSLTVEGPVAVAPTGEESGRLAITGGTNRFKSASGEVELRAVEGGLLFSFHVLL
jgi:hypothetical protein